MVISMNIEKLYKYLPINNIDWNLIENELLHPFVKNMKETMQEAKWHGEGDVWTHTKMVCEELIKLNEYQELPKAMKLVVFLAALFHDIAKPVCTKIIDGEIRSFKHPATGALITRNYLWKELGLSGKKEYQEFREAISLLVRYHSEPTYLDYEDNKEKLVIKLSLNSNLTKYFNNKLLALLATSDIKGRISDTNEEKLSVVEEFKQLAINLNCYENSFKFNNTHTKIKYLENDNVWYQDSLYDSTWGEVILICGLPGTGKDTYIKKHYPNHKIISLDDIREKYKIKPTENQGEVYNIAKDEAKSYLRQHISFVWNATNITKMIRDKQIKLFHEYGARVKVIFLETEYQEMLKRNNNRKRYVSEKVINDMLEKLEIIEDFEAEIVEWICI